MNILNRVILGFGELILIGIFLSITDNAKEFLAFRDEAERRIKNVSGVAEQEIGRLVDYISYFDSSGFEVVRLLCVLRLAFVC